MGCTLIISRKIKLHNYFINKLIDMGFRNVKATSVDKTGLDMLINDIKPRTVIIDVEFYKSASCYMINLLMKRFEKIDFIVVSFYEYPVELGMWLIYNGVKSFINLVEGDEQFFYGLECVRDGKQYISPDIQECMDTREFFPLLAVEVSDKEFQIWRCLCNGFTETETAIDLDISTSTVGFYKTKLLNNLGTRNDKEAMRVAHYLKTFKDGELNFYGRNYELGNKKPKTNYGKKKSC